MKSWYLEVLACPICSNSLTEKNNLLVCDVCGKSYSILGGNIIVSNQDYFKSQSVLKFYRYGTRLRERCKVKYSTSYYETPIYIDFIKKNICNKCERDVVIDVGCGDGRFTELLLNEGFNKIIAVDISIENLIRLREYYNNTYKILLINSDVLLVPLKSEIADVIIAIEVLYYLGDRYRDGLQVISKLLKPDGIAIISEPLVEGAALYQLVRNDLSEFCKTIKEKVKKEINVCGEVIYTRVFELEEIEKIFRENGFEILNKRGIPALPSLCAYVLNSKDYPEELKNFADAIIKELVVRNKPPFRCMCYSLSKK